MINKWLTYSLTHNITSEGHLPRVDFGEEEVLLITVKALLLVERIEIQQ